VTGIVRALGKTTVIHIAAVAARRQSGQQELPVSELLLLRGEHVVGIDALIPYYDPALKRARLNNLKQRPGFTFFDTELADAAATESAFDAIRPDRIVHLAAQPGVRVHR
jgi:UDP-glucuronate 4-epimerase